jgi:hypothetical protein
MTRGDEASSACIDAVRKPRVDVIGSWRSRFSDQIRGRFAGRGGVGGTIRAMGWPMRELGNAGRFAMGVTLLVVVVVGDGCGTSAAPAGPAAMRDGDIEAPDGSTGSSGANEGGGDAAGEMGFDSGDGADATSGAAEASVDGASSSGFDSSSGILDASADGAGSGGSCTLTGTLSATIANTPSFACVASSCSPLVTACGADCVCNNTYVTALLCVQSGGATTPCFTAAIGSSPDNANVNSLTTCIQAQQGGCAASQHDH